MRQSPSLDTAGPLRTLRRIALLGVPLVIAMAAAGTSAIADSDVVIKTSRAGVKETIDALAADLAAKGIAIIARVDHAAGAKAAGLSLPPTELVIFGNPKLGTPLMQSNRAIGLDLPMKVLAFEDADGSVKIAYTAPAALLQRHGIGDRTEIVEAMSKALDKLTGGLAAPAP